jgi:hypothetical protein
MASGIFAILDDIAALMDDVAVASKVATKQTAGILGDDLAVNAEKATGFVSSRELPVLWAITKGSFINKLIIVPIAMLLNYYLPIAITMLLLAGACYLAFEGVEKVIHFLFHRSHKAEHDAVGVSKPNDDVEDEKAKVNSAIRTDFILSVEIVIIALGTVLDKSLSIQIISVVIVSILATVGVYGLVALIVRMDDAGYKLIAISKGKRSLRYIGISLIKTLPYIIKFFSVGGTLALILVAGGIFVHKIEFLHHLYPQMPSIVKEAAVGLVGGLIMVGIITVFTKIWKVVKR